nr:hypothetical protein Iba_chr10cCG10710 [Ipomoea batatas]
MIALRLDSLDTKPLGSSVRVGTRGWTSCPFRDWRGRVLGVPNSIYIWAFLFLGELASFLGLACLTPLQDVVADLKLTRSDTLFMVCFCYSLVILGTDRYASPLSSMRWRPRLIGVQAAQQGAVVRPLVEYVPEEQIGWGPPLHMVTRPPCPGDDRKLEILRCHGDEILRFESSQSIMPYENDKEEYNGKERG